MSESKASDTSFGSAVGRWKGLGPYYAMFPVDFAFDIVAKYSRPGGAVLDPFAGRASSVFAACAQNRIGYGIEINAVGWIYGRVKLHPASEKRVLQRVEQLDMLARQIDDSVLRALPPFFAACYTPYVLRFLLSARAHLQWQTSVVDRTVAAFLLVYLHGKAPYALSSQMRQGKAMAPDYSVRWWEEHGYTPPDINPVDFLNKRIKWRYAKGKPNVRQGNVWLADSTKIVGRLQTIVDKRRRRFNLLFTSPPYCGLTNYYYDQWLRLWLLGGPAQPEPAAGEHRGKFYDRERYKNMLLRVFKGCAEVMSRNATIYVRTDAREFTYEATVAALKEAFPKKDLTVFQQPLSKQTQTSLYGDKETKPGEVDLLLRSGHQ